MNKKNSNVFVYLLLGIGGIFFISCFISSCGKTTVLPAASNILYQVVNLSPDLLPVNLLIDNNNKNSSPYTYPNPSGYFALTSIDTPFQIRSSSVLVSTTNFVSSDTLLKNNLRYTLFITGLRANNSVTSILTVDTASAVTAGRGKIRFVNASPGSGGIDITANSTYAFTNRLYLGVSKFIELPAGNYDFKAYPTGNTTTLLSDLPGITVQDGKIYTLYCRGIVARTDSAAFGLAVIPNNP